MDVRSGEVYKDTLDILREKLLARTASVDSSIFSLSSIYKIDMHFKPNILEPVFSDTILLVQSAGTGACCCIGEIPTIDSSCLGTDVRTLNVKNRCLAIALLDSAYGYFKELPTLTFQLIGASATKAQARATLVANEVHRLLSRTIVTRRPRVAIVGAVGNIIAELLKTGCDVFATDMDTKTIGCVMSGIIVEDGQKQTLSRIMQCDLALVTGSTLASNTIDEILQCRKERGNNLIFYAQTGSNFATELLALGADTVICEQFPFYMFPGDSTVNIYRKL